MIGDQKRRDEEQRVDVEVAVFDLLQKFHRETDCGERGDHWIECDRLAQAIGEESWEAWIGDADQD